MNNSEVQVAFSCPYGCGFSTKNDDDDNDTRCTEFWHDVFNPSVTDQPFGRAKCPNCGNYLQQCHYCNKSTIDEYCTKQGRSAKSRMRRHYEYVHEPTINKRPKLNEPETPDCMDVDFSTNNEQYDDDNNEGYDDNNEEDCYYSSDDEEEENEIQLSEHEKLIQQTANALLEAQETIQLKEVINMEGLENDISHLNERTDGEEEEDDSTVSGDSNGQCNYDNGRSIHNFDRFEIFNEGYETKYVKGDKSKPPRINQNQAYFYSEHAHGKNGGWRRNVGLSNVGDRERIDKIANVDEAEAMFYMLKLLYTLPESKRNEYCTAQEKIDKVKQPQNLSTDTEFPTDKNVMNRKIFKGKNSIVANMPHPQVKLQHGHATVGLIETIRHSLGHGAKFNFAYNGATKERNTEGLNGTIAMEKLIKDVVSRHQDNKETDEINRTKIGYLLPWSDSFLRCFTKQKENSVWILTVTVCPPEDDMSSSLYTYVLAMGRSDLDHAPIIKHFMEEVLIAMNGFECYDGSNDKFQRVAFGMIAWNADRPERQSITGQRKEGLNGLVNGWATAPDQTKFPSCPKCYIRLMEATEDNPVSPCEDGRCCNFVFFDGASKDGNPSDDNKIHYNNKTSDAYPSTYVDLASYPNKEHLITKVPPCRAIGLKYLCPIKLTSDLATTLLKVAYTGVVLGQWTSANFKEYLKTCNISGVLVDSLYEHAETDKEKPRYNPDSVEQDIWELFECFGFLFPNLPMHGLCHGMIPDVLDILMRILKKKEKGENFNQYANMILSEISKLGLSYCKVKNLPKAAWVAENSLAFMRLMSYLFGSYLSQHPLGSSPKDKEVTMHIMCMLNAFQRLVSLLMSKKSVSKVTIDNSMRLFMASAHYLNKVYGVLSDKKHKVPKGERFLAKVETSVLVSIAKKLGVYNANWNEHTKKTTIINKIRKPRKEKLLKFLTESEQKKCKDFVKDEIIKEIYLKMCRDGEECDRSGLDAAEEQSPTNYFYCWYKGNWLSFLATIADQVETLGPLPLIW